MTVTKKVCTAIIIGSFLSWGLWIVIEMVYGKGFLYNSSGLLFGLILTALALLIHFLYFKMNKQGIIYGILSIGCLFSISMFVLSYFTVSH
jgi:accessory gene regulator protein AgrB